MYGLYGAYDYHGFARQASKFVCQCQCGARRVLFSTLIHEALLYIRILGLTAQTGINEWRLRRPLNRTQAGTHAKLDKI